MTEQVLGIYTWPRKAENVNISPQFRLSQYSLYSLSKWIGGFNKINKNIYQNKRVNYNIDYTNPEYHLIDWNLFKTMISNPLFNFYKKYYYNEENSKKYWYNGIAPRIALPNMKKIKNNILFSKDPVFSEKVIIENPNSHIFIIGDIHSSIHSLLDIVINLKNKNVFNKGDTLIIDSNCYIFFLGDLVDRGPYSIEVLSFVLLLKLHNKNNVFILNGNHEDYETYGHIGHFGSGLLDEIINQFGEGNDKEELHSLMHAFPSVIYLKFMDKLYHLSHGGILSPAKNRNFIDIKKWIHDDNNDKKFFLNEIYNPNNPLKWGDFKIEMGYEEPKLSNRGRPNFGLDIVEEYCKYFNINSIISGHQDLESFMIIPKRYIDIKIINQKPTYKSKAISRIFKNLIIPDEIVIGSDKYGYNKFVYCKKLPYLCKYPYDLYSISDKKYKKYREMNATEDFYALTTSTATISKGLEYNCYLELYIKK